MRKDLVAGQDLPGTVVGMIAEKNSSIDNAILRNKVNMIIAKTPKIATMQAGAISEAILKAMIPDPTLQDHDDIYFVPYGNKIDVSFSHNYLQKLAYRNGAVKLIDTQLIYEEDWVEVTEGGVSFKINPFKKDRGEFVGIMVLVKLANNETKYGFVSKDHIEKARKMSKSGSSGPWKMWYLEMAKKVAIKNTLKGIDISQEFSDAVTIDNEGYSTSKDQIVDDSEENEKDLQDKIMYSSNKISEAKEFLEDNDISYESKGDWIMVDLQESDFDGVEKLTSTNINIIKKDDKPNKIFIKVGELMSLIKDNK
jgi:phage RecT family recombinase